MPLPTVARCLKAQKNEGGKGLPRALIATSQAAFIGQLYVSYCAEPDTQRLAMRSTILSEHRAG